MNPYATVALSVTAVFLVDHMRMMIAQETKTMPERQEATQDMATPQASAIPWLAGSTVSASSGGVSIVSLPTGPGLAMKVWGKAYDRSYLMDSTGIPVKQGVMLLRDDGTAFFLAGKQVEGGPYRVESTSVENGEVLHYFKPLSTEVVIVQAAYSQRPQSKRATKS